MIEAMAATQGHTQSLHTNALDEALALPTDFSARIARNTQILLQQESGTTRIVDPWGGSFYVERLTYELAKARLGSHPGGRGAWAAWPRRSRPGCPSCASRKPRRGRRRASMPAQQAVIGVNKYRPNEEPPIDLLKVDNAAVRQLQIDKLARLRRERDPQGGRGRAGRAHPQCRRRQRQSARARDRRRARQGHGRRNLGGAGAGVRPPSGGDQGDLRRLQAGGRRHVGSVARVQKLVAEFEANEGRRPRILVAKIGQDGHDRGQKVIASAFADLGFDVDIGPLFATPEEAARQAVENDVHILGISSLAAAHLTLVPQLKAALEKQGRDDIMIVVGGVVPPQDYEALTPPAPRRSFRPGR